MNSPMEVRKIIRQLRKERGMSQAKIGELTGIGRSTISRIENGIGKNHLSLGRLRRLATALGYRLEIRFIRLEQ